MSFARLISDLESAAIRVEVGTISVNDRDAKVWDERLAQDMRELAARLRGYRSRRLCKVCREPVANHPTGRR